MSADNGTGKPSRSQLREERRRELTAARAQDLLTQATHEDGGESAETLSTRQKLAHEGLARARQLRRRVRRLFGSQ